MTRALLHSVGAKHTSKNFTFLNHNIDNLEHLVRPRQLQLATHTMEATRRLKPSASLIHLCTFLYLLSPLDYTGV